MLLHELDQDVLAIIVSLLSAVRYDVVNLSLTCRRLYMLGRQPEEIIITSPSNRLALTRSCIEDQSYGHQARSLSLKICGKRTTSRYTIFSLLQRMPNLQSLTLDADVNPHFLPALLNRNLTLRQNLRHLHLTDSTLTTPDLFSLLSLPRLRHLEIPSRREIAYSGHDSALFRQRPSQIHHLRIFDLGSNTYLQPSLLEEILSHCPDLHTLEANITLPLVTPAHALDQGPWTHPFYPRPTQYNSPERLLSTLECGMRSLVNLSLVSNGVNGIMNDGSRLDLSAFMGLKRVRVSADLFLGDGGSGVGRDGLYRLLPPNVEHFTLLFGANTRIFYNSRFNTNDTKNQFLKGPDESMTRWITEIAENKEACFPRLKKVVLRELLKEGKKSHWRAVEERWVLKGEVERVFEEVSVELSVWIRREERTESRMEGR